MGKFSPLFLLIIVSGNICEKLDFLWTACPERPGDHQNPPLVINRKVPVRRVVWVHMAGMADNTADMAGTEDMAVRR